MKNNSAMSIEVFFQCVGTLREEITATVNFFLVNEIMLLRILPRHFCLSLVNPGLQEQMNDPAVFAHVAFLLLQL